MKSYITIVAAAALSLASASAATIDLSEADPGLYSEPLELSNATLTALGENSAVEIQEGEGDSFCFNATGTGFCNANGRIDFTSEVENLSFDLSREGGRVDVLALDTAGKMLVGFKVFEGGKIDFGELSGIAALTFTYKEQSDGYFFGGFDFDFVSSDGGSIPIPAAAPLMLAGLGLLVRKRRKQA